MNSAAAHPALTAGQAEILGQALADAIYYRDPPLNCPGCETPASTAGLREGPALLCPQCQATLNRARAYLDLSRQLGLSPPRQAPPSKIVKAC